VTEVWTTVPTPVGELLLVAVDGALVKAHFPPFEAPSAEPSPDEPVLAEAGPQLTEHFAGERTDFDLPLAPPGTAFQHRVWEELRRIPYGTTATYGEGGRAARRPQVRARRRPGQRPEPDRRGGSRATG
jgi:methylated-DNA-[protein]-cysteine S-methyltransferase